LCKPEHEWSEKPRQFVAQSIAQPTTHDHRLQFHGISVTSRGDNEFEINEMTNFIKAAHKQSLTPYVRSLSYDSNACCCFFEFADEVEPEGNIANELLEVALETIGQFEWFGQIQHGRQLPRDEGLPL
jgi:hypothetical protein